ncbi:MAG TPA: hypothetical protein VK426_05600 [Methanobacterium sp.]|nr:hypothetical protein [Methanobacterium sp.]
MTVDLLFASVIILFIVIGILSVASERIDSVSSTDEFGNSRMVVESVAETINKVYDGGNGHETILSLPANVSNKNYNIKVNSTGVYILIDGNIGKSFINSRRISSSDKLTDSTILMYCNHSYILKNVKDSDGNTWIVISEI